MELDIDELWADFYPRIKNIVASRVRSINRSVANESEIALSAFHSLINAANAGRAATDRDELWKLVCTIAIRKANDARKHLRAQKRGGKVAVVGQADSENEHGGNVVDSAKAACDAPEADVEISDFFNHMLAQLPDDRHRDVVLLKLQGAPVALIAECLNTTTRTVQRMLNRIEELWHSATRDS